MARWVKCTRKHDTMPIYVNTDAAMTLRWNETDQATIIAYAGGDVDSVKLLERPENILG